MSTHEGDTMLSQLVDDPDNDPLGDIKTGIKAWFDVGLSIGKSADELTRGVDKLWKRLQRDTPVYYGQSASGVFPASGSLLLALGSPDQGTFWEVHGCVVGGTDYNVTATGTAGLYVAANTQARGMTQLADQALTLPNVAFYGTEQVIVNDNEQIFIWVDAGASGQTYAANVQASVYNVAAAGGVVESVA